MGLFADTLSDARRPLGGGWLRRSADASAAMPDEAPDDGMQTVFRFQKGQSPAVMPGGYQEASIQPATEKTVPAADLWSAESAMETSPSPADRFKNGVSAYPKANQKRILETVQVERNDPQTIVAANANSESAAFRSVMSGRFDTDAVRETHKSNVQAASERHVSETGVTFGSRPSGRGAPPSEFFDATASNHDAATALSSAVAAPVAPSRPAPSAVAAVPGSALARASGAPPGHLAPKQATANPTTASMPTVAHATGHYFDSPGGAATGPAATAAVAPRAPAARRAQPATPAAPSLVIGRIDVTVIADAAPRAQTTSPRADNGFLSRNYLKRL